MTSAGTTDWVTDFLWFVSASGHGLLSCRGVILHSEDRPDLGDLSIVTFVFGYKIKRVAVFGERYRLTCQKGGIARYLKGRMKIGQQYLAWSFQTQAHGSIVPLCAVYLLDYIILSFIAVLTSIDVFQNKRQSIFIRCTANMI